jgi:hypothetical protein
MLNSVERNSNTDLKTMWKLIADDLISFGFSLELAADDNGEGSPNMSSSGTTYGVDTVLYVFKPTLKVDPLADVQNWRFIIRLEDIEDGIAYSYSLNALTSTQLINSGDGEFSVSSPSEEKEMGILNATSSKNVEDKHFFSRKSEYSKWSCFKQGGDSEAWPISYRLSVTDHGFLLVTWAEAQDSSGDCFNWLVIQRPVDLNGDILIEGHAPLFCLFSLNGGGSSDVNKVVPEGINLFVVREKGINAPTLPQSAVIPTADSSPILNPIQQVSLTEEGKYLLTFPKGLNTHRYCYSEVLDLICYTSADVISQWSEPTIIAFGEERDYKAISANHPNNKGMRLLVITKGAGIT